MERTKHLDRMVSHLLYTNQVGITSRKIFLLLFINFSIMAASLNKLLMQRLCLSLKPSMSPQHEISILSPAVMSYTRLFLKFWLLRWHKSCQISLILHRQPLLRIGDWLITYSGLNKLLGAVVEAQQLPVVC